MRACVQRVAGASVVVDGEAGEEVVGRIDSGLLVLLGVAADDTPDDARQLAQKIVELRVFEDDDGKLNCALAEAGGAMLVVSQFTLLGDCRKGRRPSFSSAAPPELAERLYEDFVAAVPQPASKSPPAASAGTCGAALVNDGPVTLLLDSRKLF